MARITLYRDPQDMQQPDEEVELVRRLVKYTGLVNHRLEWWIVKFDDGYEAERWVHESQIPEDMQAYRKQKIEGGKENVQRS